MQLYTIYDKMTLLRLRIASMAYPRCVCSPLTSMDSPRSDRVIGRRLGSQIIDDSPGTNRNEADTGDQLERYALKTLRKNRAKKNCKRG